MIIACAGSLLNQLDQSIRPRVPPEPPRQVRFLNRHHKCCSPARRFLVGEHERDAVVAGCGSSNLPPTEPADSPEVPVLEVLHAEGDLHSQGEQEGNCPGHHHECQEKRSDVAGFDRVDGRGRGESRARDAHHGEADSTELQWAPRLAAFVRTRHPNSLARRFSWQRYEWGGNQPYRQDRTFHRRSLSTTETPSPNKARGLLQLVWPTTTERSRPSVWCSTRPVGRPPRSPCPTGWRSQRR